MRCDNCNKIISQEEASYDRCPYCGTLHEAENAFNTNLLLSIKVFNGIMLVWGALRLAYNQGIQGSKVAWSTGTSQFGGLIPGWVLLCVFLFVNLVLISLYLITKKRHKR